MGEYHFAPLPIAAYGVVLLCSAVAYTILQYFIVNHEDGVNRVLASAVGGDVKGKASLVMYILAIPLAFVSVWISGALYIGVAAMWLIPDRRIEAKVKEEHEKASK